MGYEKVCKTTEIEEGQGKLFTVKGEEIAIFNVEGSFYAIHNKCPHAGVGLATGEVEDMCVTCPGHGWQFNLKNGKHVIMPVSVKTYKTKVEGGDLYVPPISYDLP